LHGERLAVGVKRRVQGGAHPRMRPGANCRTASDGGSRPSVSREPEPSQPETARCSRSAAYSAWLRGSTRARACCESPTASGPSRPGR
jgi:hypothetical protein